MTPYYVDRSKRLDQLVGSLTLAFTKFFQSHVVTVVDYSARLWWSCNLADRKGAAELLKETQLNSTEKTS